MVEQSDITFCVKTFNRPQPLFRCLGSLRWASPKSSIVVVDDSTMEYDYPDPLLNHINLIRTEPNIGLSAGRNRAVEAVQTPFCFVLDDDHGLQKRSKWLESLSHVPGKWLDGIVGWPLRYPLRRMIIGGAEFYKRQNDIAVVATSCESCDIVLNNFLATKDLLQSHPWPDSMKTREHFTWFYEMSISSQPPPIHQMPKQYAWLHMSGPETYSVNYRPRRKAHHLQGESLKKHSIKKLSWAWGPIVEEYGSD